MFGIGSRNDQQDSQIPYEVYETVQDSSFQRRRWIIRLVAALIVVTLLIVAGMAIRNALDKDDAANNPKDQTQGQNDGASQNNDALPAETVNQSPQQNTSGAGTDVKPATTPQSGADNNSTVRKPE